MTDPSLTLVDLFSGCGGLALGMHGAGFETVLANELHPDPATTFVHNLCPEAPERMLVGPIQDQLSQPRLRRLLSEIDNDIDCVAGGPPCQGFSNAGRGNPDDPRNQLFKEYLRVVGHIKPKTVIFENVPGFANRYGLGLRNRLNQYLSKKGYEVCSEVLTASDFGVPQLRRRFFTIGVRRDIFNEEDMSMPDHTYSPERQKRELTCEAVIGDLDTYEERGGYGIGTIHGDWDYGNRSAGPYQSEMRRISGRRERGKTWNTRIPAHTQTVIRRMSQIQKGLRNEDFQGTDLQTAKLTQRSLTADEVPRITVVSIPDDYIHYNQRMPRTLSVRECARLQTFPDHFHFYGKRTSGGLRRRVEVPQYTQVGNAVPPRLAGAIGQHLASFLQG